jgi:hypothetical protein
LIGSDGSPGRFRFYFIRVFGSVPVGIFVLYLSIGADRDATLNVQEIGVDLVQYSSDVIQD